MPGILCEHCTAVCCRYIALPLDTPETRADFDDLRWYLIHEGISVFVEDGDWYISMQTTCQHLQTDHRCGIYASRPRICREYTTESCDYHSGDYNWQAHFSTPEHLDEYLRENPPKEPRRAKRGRGDTRGRTRLRARLQPARRGRASDAGRSPATHDPRGVPLPVLELAP